MRQQKHSPYTTPMISLCRKKIDNAQTIKGKTSFSLQNQMTKIYLSTNNTSGVFVQVP